MIFLGIIFGVAFGATLFLTPWVIRLARRYRVFDQPSDRKKHREPMVLLGGLSMFLSVVMALSLQIEWSRSLKVIVAGAFVLVLAGILDDIKVMRPLGKLVIQVAVALGVSVLGVRIEFLSGWGGDLIFLGSFSIVISVIWIVGMINTINLLDGSDGLAAGISAISALVMSVVAYRMGQHDAVILSLVMSGVCFGFLKYNFSPARIFMGDSGSMMLGFLLACISITGVLKTTLALSFLAPLLVLGIPISDTAFAIIRRLKDGRNVFHADLGHFHHRLLAKGFSPRQVAYIFYGGTLILGGVTLFVFM